MVTRGKGGFDRRSFLKYSGLAGSGAILAGCTGNQSSTTTADNSGGSTTPGSVTSDSSHDSSAAFEFVTTITPSSLDPMKGADNLETVLLHNTYDPLLSYTDETPPALENWLATGYTVSDDKRTYTFSLRKDATFHNGDPVTASDVVYSFQRMMDMQQGFSWMWSGLLDPANVEATDAHTVTMTTSKVFAPFPYTLPFFFVVNEKQVTDHVQSDGPFGDNGDYGTAWLEDNDAGSGPYALATRDRKQRIVLKRNPDWWGSHPNGTPYQSVTTTMVQESATVAGKMKEGAQMSDQWLPLTTYDQLAQVDGISVSANATFNPFYIYMHTQRKPLNDVHVRRAISYAFDSETALTDVMAGDSTHLNGPLPSAMWSHTNSLPTYERDLDKARAELEKSDYSASDIDLTYTYVSGLSTEQNMGLLLQSNLQELGAKVSVEKTPWTKLTQLCTSKDTTPDMMAVYLGFSYADPDTFLYPAWHSSSHGSWTSATWYENADVDTLLTKGRQTIGKKNRVPIYQRAQKLIAADAPALFVMNQATRYAVADSVGGFRDNGIIGYHQSFQRFYQE